VARNMASMRDVAILAKVSISTVSRALSGAVPVDEKTRQRVQRAVETLRFKPDLLASGLRARSGRIVGLIVPDARDPISAAVISFVGESVTARGYQLVLGVTRGEPDREGEFVESLARRHGDGVIVESTASRPRLRRSAEKNGLSVVILDGRPESEDMPTVVADEYQAGALAAQYLLSIGHRHLACIVEESTVARSNERQSGFKDTLVANGAELRQTNVYEGDRSFAAGVDAVRSFLSRRLSFTAVWAASDIAALGAMAELRHRGLSMPDDVSVMGTDDTSWAELSVPALTTIRLPLENVCETAVQLILDPALGRDVAGARVVAGPEVVARESTRAV
jgi:DNA-binding LacI/PurR family transcriptional regulator